MVRETMSLKFSKHDYFCKKGHRFRKTILIMYVLIGRNMIHTTFDVRFKIFPFYLDTIFFVKLVILFFNFKGVSFIK